jgi:Fur family ferric uptake transcriptional regulator
MQVHTNDHPQIEPPPPDRWEAAVDEVERRLADRGLRRKRQRRAVLEALLGSRRCLSAAQVCHTARRRSPELGLMTVYRTLDLLADMGVVRRVHGEDRCEGFVPALGHHGHAVVCTSCGRASEFTDCHLEVVAAAAASETGFSIGDHFLQFSGVCRDCQTATTVSMTGVRGDREQGGTGMQEGADLQEGAGAEAAGT